MRDAKLGLIVLLALLLAACAQPSPTAPVGTPATGYPGPEGNVATPVIIEIVPTPSASDKATITGKLMVDPAAPQPAAGLILYLADILPEAQGTPFLASFDRIDSPRTLTDANGLFVFADVEPQDYSLVLDRISESYLLWDPELGAGNDFIFTAQPGEILDLGELVYTQLPGG